MSGVFWHSLVCYVYVPVLVLRSADRIMNFDGFDAVSFGVYLLPVG